MLLCTVYLEALTGITVPHLRESVFTQKNLSINDCTKFKSADQAELNDVILFTNGSLTNETTKRILVSVLTAWPDWVYCGKSNVTEK